jgi:hypothetical protein
VTDELQRLWELRDLDERIGAGRVAVARFDTERKELAERLESERVRRESVQHRLGDLQVRRRAVEKDIEATVAEERKFQTQLLAVKKNEEYQALLHEIAGVRQRRSDMETRVLQTMEEEEAAQRERREAERALESAEREIAERGARADRDQAAERQRLEGLEAERQTVLGGLPAAIGARYQRIHASRDGRAIVPILKGACGGCFRQQPPQALQEARRRDRILVCDGCGRLLIMPPEEP